ncbi:MAG: glycosyltransferase [Deltaproteobacteria bacterium]|nr:MAG: glycosyltransferase [Deltaproteobacteria bacterium]
MGKNLDYSVVVPVYNEEENLRPLTEAIVRVMERLGGSYEIVYVDDGSTDGSVSVIRDLQKTYPVIRLIRLRKNFGQAAALSAGFDHSRGRVVISLDADLQNDPEDIPAMVEKLEEGFDVVCGWRKERKDRTLSRKVPSLIANWLIRRLTKVTVHDYGCTLKVFKREVVEHLPLYGGLHRFIPALAVDFGARVTEMVVKHHPRKFGKSKYNITRTFPVLMDLLYITFTMRFSRKPFYFFGGSGFLLAAVGGLIILYLSFLKLFLGQSIGGRPLLIFGVLFVLGGMQLFSVGLLAGLLYKLHVESRAGTTYSVREVIEPQGKDEEGS